jgi:hypothetical protein
LSTARSYKKNMMLPEENIDFDGSHYAAKLDASIYYPK